MQVGIGNGNASNTIQGDYDFWFLPQRDELLDVAKGATPARAPTTSSTGRCSRPPRRAERSAPTWPAGTRPTSPSARSCRGRPAGHGCCRWPARCTRTRTPHVGQLVTAYPDDYYPGTEWKSDMLWGATEIALADKGLACRAAAASRPRPAAAWAQAYIAQGHPAGSDTLNLYDNGAIAEASCCRACGTPGIGPGRPFHPRLLVNDLAAQLRWARRGPRATRSRSTPASGRRRRPARVRALGHQGSPPRGGSAATRRSRSSSSTSPSAQRVGFLVVVGAGTAYPHCLQSEIANLAGSLTGHGDIQLGAITDGPSSPANFVGLGTVSGMRACSARVVLRLQHRRPPTRTTCCRGPRWSRPTTTPRSRCSRSPRGGVWTRLTDPLMMARSRRCWRSTAATARPTSP